VAGVSENFSEQALLLGNRNALVGIITRPSPPPPNEKAAVVILNTGIVHRVGHNRMYVSLARMLAGAGHVVLRFDLSGIGDSEQRHDKLSTIDSSLADIREALDFLADSRQASRFVLIGLCSGADHAVLYGPTDPRVVGLVLMDPSIPPTTRYYVHYILQRLTRLQNWGSVAAGKSGLLRMLKSQLAHRLRPTPETSGLTLETLKFNPYLARCYATSVANGIRILAAFTSISPRQTYRAQILDAFPQAAFKDSLKLEHFTHSDHLFSDPNDRSRLDQLVLDWLSTLPRETRSAASTRSISSSSG
jgi:alpha-beta hydrolase superfamily lysophospholipase